MTSNTDPQDAVPADQGTVHLNLQPEDAAPEPQDAVPSETGTVRLGRAAVPGQAPDPDGVPTVRLPAGSEPAPPAPTLMLPIEPEATPAPVPTPTVQIPVAAQPAEAAVAPEAPVAAAPDPGLIRFGPGVPDPKTARTIAVWKGEVAPEPEAEEKKRRGWLFWVPVLLVFLALLGWWLYGLLAPSPLKITAASVQVTPTSLTCNGKATVTATVVTDGSGGTFRYRWLRSDGTDSGWLTETVAVGTHSVQLPLIWTLSGPGTFDGKATLEIEDHPALTETGAFAYSCASD